MERSGEAEAEAEAEAEVEGEWHTHFLISYLSSWPFFTLAKSHATTYWPVEVTIATSSLPSPASSLSLSPSSSLTTRAALPVQPIGSSCSSPSVSLMTRAALRARPRARE